MKLVFLSPTCIIVVSLLFIAHSTSRSRNERRILAQKAEEEKTQRLVALILWENLESDQKEEMRFGWLDKIQELLKADPLTPYSVPDLRRALEAEAERVSRVQMLFLLYIFQGEGIFQYTPHLCRCQKMAENGEKMWCYYYRP